MFEVPAPLQFLKLCNAPCRLMVDSNLLFIINVQTFHMTFTKPIRLYSHPPLRIITIVVHVIAVGMCPSLNVNFFTLTILYHSIGSGLFCLVAYLIQDFIFLYLGSPLLLSLKVYVA